MTKQQASKTATVLLFARRNHQQTDASSSSVDEYVGHRIRHYRKAAGLTAHDVATRAELSLDEFILCEKGKSTLYASTLSEIAGLLNVSISAFFPSHSNPLYTEGSAGNQPAA